MRAAWGLATVLTLMTILPVDKIVHGAPGARLLISGPFVAYGEAHNEIHQFDLETQTRSTLRSFSTHPGSIALGPDGALYVAMSAEEKIYKLNPLTGATVGIVHIPLAPLSYFGDIAVKPNGNLLVIRELGNAGTGQVDEYAPDGTHLSLWLDTHYLVHGIKMTPNGKVALLCCGHPGYEPNELVEYELDGSNPRVVIDQSMGVRMYSFEFASSSEIVVVDRGSDPYGAQETIKRFDWSSTPATYLGELVSVPAPIPLGIARNSADGALYGAGPHLGGEGCVHGWASDGMPLNGGQPFPTCYGQGPLYAGEALVINDCGGLADCNGNFVSDDCDIHDGTSQDCNDNEIPDECEPDIHCDSDNDGIADSEDECSNSDLSETIVIGECDTGIANELFQDGCSMMDLIESCEAEAGNHGQFVRCVGYLARHWREAGLINALERARIVRCAAGSQNPRGPGDMTHAPRPDGSPR